MDVDIQMIKGMKRFLMSVRRDGAKLRQGKGYIKRESDLEGNLTTLTPHHQRIIDGILDLNNDPTRKVNVPSHLANYAYHVKEQWFREYQEMSGHSLCEILYCGDD